MVIGRDGQSWACDPPAASVTTASTKNHKRDITEPFDGAINLTRLMAPYHCRDDAGQPKFCAQRKMILSRMLLPERDA
jgi:hypothetical protein